MKKKKEKKLKISDINKNNQIERKNFIHKFIEHEHEIMIWTTVLIFIIICLVGYTCFFAVKYKDKVEVYYDGKLKISYNVDVTGVTDLVSTYSGNIVDGDTGEKNEYTFKVKNNSLTKVKYLVYIEEDTELIKIDECRDKLVNLDALRFSIDNKKPVKLKKLSDDMYSISKDTLNPNEEKEIKLKVWIDKNSMEDINKYHFHGRIVIVSL